MSMKNYFLQVLFGKVILSKNDFFTIGIVYRSPNSDESGNIKLLNQIDFISKKFLSSNEKLLLVGDFNFPGINWIDEQCNMSENHSASKFFLYYSTKLYDSIYQSTNSLQKLTSTNTH